MIFGDMKSEDEKLSYALELAFAEISKDKTDPDDPEKGTIPDSDAKPKEKKVFLGTNNLIKLPYVIGTPEYYKHPYAGIVYMGNLDQELE